jgi:hypothetical protein
MKSSGMRLLRVTPRACRKRRETEMHYTIAWRKQFQWEERIVSGDPHEATTGKRSGIAGLLRRGTRAIWGIERVRPHLVVTARKTPKNAPVSKQLVDSRLEKNKTLSKDREVNTNCAERAGA